MPFVLCEQKRGTGEGVWVHPKCAGHVTQPLFISTGSAISVIFGINGIRNKPFYQHSYSEVIFFMNVDGFHWVCRVLSMHPCFPPPPYFAAQWFRPP